MHSSKGLTENMLTTENKENGLHIFSMHTKKCRYKHKKNNSISFLFKEPSSSLLYKKPEKGFPQTDKLTETFQPALQALQTIQLICEMNSAWKQLAPYAKHNKPNGIELFAQLLTTNLKKEVIGDNTIQNTFESLISIAKVHKAKFSLTRSFLTDEFYKIIASLRPINELDTLKKISDLQTKLDHFKRKLDYLTDKYNKPSTCFNCL